MTFDLQPSKKFSLNSPVGFVATGLGFLTALAAAVVSFYATPYVASFILVLM